MPRNAFTLIELSIVILIISLILGGIMTIQNQNVRAERAADLIRKMDVIAEALYQYRLVNDKLPCPASFQHSITSGGFGVEEGAPCQGSTARSNDDIVGGGVPVRTIGLADDFAIDPWGNQFTYYIDKEANDSSNFTGSYITDGVPISGSLTATDESGNTINSDIFAVILSHGPNGHGAYTAYGQVKSAGSTNTSELENCMCDSDGSADINSSLAIRIQRNLTTTASDLKTSYDDVVRVLPRNFFYTYSEKSL